MKTNRQTGKIIRTIATGILLLACLFMLILPFPKRTAHEEKYICHWSDASVSEENYYTAYQSLYGMGEEGVILKRNGKTGIIASEAVDVFHVLQSGSLGELLALKVKGTRIDRAALYRTFGKTVWYEDGYLVFTGEQVKYVKSAQGSTLVYLSGNVLASVLKNSNATTLEVRAEASVRQRILSASSINTLRAEAPYMTDGEALYLDTAGGKRLIAAVASITSLIVENADFCDEGALIGCDRLTHITLPFVGSGREESSSFKGELAHLFQSGEEYYVPASLVSLRVTGGLLISYAFYGTRLKEIDACLVPKENISETAFAGLDTLEYLHSPKSGLTLSGNFTSELAPCGCTVYRKVK